MKITDKSKLAIGNAVTFCCHMDLEEVTEQNIDEIIIAFDDYGYEAWDSMASAYEEIATRWDDGSEEQKECLDALAKLREGK